MYYVYYVLSADNLPSISPLLASRSYRSSSLQLHSRNILFSPSLDLTPGPRDLLMHMTYLSIPMKECASVCVQHWRVQIVLDKG